MTDATQVTATESGALEPDASGIIYAPRVQMGWTDVLALVLAIVWIAMSRHLTWWAPLAIALAFLVSWLVRLRPVLVVRRDSLELPGFLGRVRLPVDEIEKFQRGWFHTYARTRRGRRKKMRRLPIDRLPRKERERCMRVLTLWLETHRIAGVFD